MIRDAILRNLFSATVLMVLGLHCASAGAADAQTLHNCHSGGELDGGVGGTYHLVARMPSA
jgi:hypothetical protein